MEIEKMKEAVVLYDRLKEMKYIEEDLERYKNNGFLIAFLASRGEEISRYDLPESMRTGIMGLVKEEINVITRKIEEL